MIQALAAQRGSAAVAASSTDSAVVTYQQLGLAHRGRIVLRGVDGCVRRGSLTAVIGPNGAGKSTLLRATLGLLKPAHGQITCHIPRERIAYLAQQSQIDRQFPLSVLDCVMLGFWPAARLWRRVGSAQREAALQALQAAGLLDFADQPIGTLSSGQFQRMLFVRVQLQDADFIVLDEPFNAVDAATTASLLDVVDGWHDEGRTVLAVLHDYQQVRARFPQALCLGEGRLLGWGPAATVLDALAPDGPSGGGPQA
ncbi:MAG: metal ABC transporter ATP-binding protein [Pigmentiphaga sp.]